MPLLGRQVHGGPVLLVHDGGVGPGQVEGPDDVLVALAAGDVKAGLALGVLSVHLGPRLYEELDKVVVSLPGRQVDGAVPHLALPGLELLLGGAEEELPGDRNITNLYGAEEGNVSLLAIIRRLVLTTPDTQSHLVRHQPQVLPAGRPGGDQEAEDVDGRGGWPGGCQVGRVGGLGTSGDAGVRLVAQQTLDGVLLPVHGGKVEGRVLLSVDRERITAQLDHPLDGGVLVLHGGVHEGRVPGHGVTDVLERSGAQVWVRALLQALESLVTAGPVSSLGEDQDLNTGKLFKLSAMTEIRNRQDFDLSLITSIAGKLFPVKFKGKEYQKICF